MQRLLDILRQRDFVVSLGFALANVAAHLIWNPIAVYWQFVVTALLFTAVLVVWLAREWRRLRLAMTKFYCIAATFDLFAEGLLQPWHQCTSANILCTGRLYLVFLAYWLVTAGWSWYRLGPTGSEARCNGG